MAVQAWKDPFPDFASCEVRVCGENKSRFLSFIDRSPNVSKLFLYGCSGRDWSEISRLKNLEQFGVNAWKHPHLEPLRSLPKLRCLFLNVYGRVTNVSPLCDLKKLECLYINGLSYCRDISALARLPRLRHFRLSGIPTPITLDSTTQFAGFTKLESLELINERFRAGSIRKFAALENLRYLHIANHYPLSDCAWLAARLPKCECWLFQATNELGLECDKCGQIGLQLIGARRRLFACPRCEPERVARHVDAFANALEQANP